MTMFPDFENTDDQLLHLVDVLCDTVSGVLPDECVHATLFVETQVRNSGDLDVRLELTTGVDDQAQSVPAPESAVLAALQMHHGFSQHGRLWQSCRMTLQRSEDTWLHETAFDPD